MLEKFTHECQLMALGTTYTDLLPLSCTEALLVQLVHPQSHQFGPILLLPFAIQPPVQAFVPFWPGLQFECS